MPCLLWRDGPIISVGETLAHIRVTLLQLCLGVSLSILGLSKASPHQHFTSPEVVIPVKVTRGRGADALGWLSYSLQFGGQRYVIHMRVKKLLISTHLPVLTYTEQHALHQTQPFVHNDCYYHGYVEGFPESLAALSTCSGGFRGMLQINEFAYEIEPIGLSATFEHLLYKIDNDEAQFPSMRCGLTEDKIAHHLELQLSYNNSVNQSSYVGWWTHQRFVELVVVVDHNRFLFSGSNVSEVQLEVFNVVNIVDSLYHTIDIDVILTGLEIWNVRNPFSISGGIDQILQQFSIWKHLNLNAQLRHDTAHLFIKELNGTKLGVAYVRAICQNPINCGVDVFKDRNLTLFAITVTHELGHNLGMLHDTQWCVCELQWCIMYAHRRVSNRFSNCSYVQYWDTAMSTGSCIHPPPYPANIFKLKYCGNRVVDKGEECDCGSVQQCASDHCCQLNCTLSPGASCASGACCNDCKFLPSGTLCRPQASECDLPEWCNGTSGQCPDDMYVQDGSLCSGSAHCYQKTCTTHDAQCKEIFGKEARSAAESCYSEINTQGNRFGHCGIVGTIYAKCLAADVMCGRVQCENVDRIPNLIGHSTVHQFQFNNTTCWGTDYHLGMSILDIGLVKDGTTCGPGKLCIGRKCASIVRLPQICQPKTCNMRGVCNNKHHCHCDHGWAPPYCNNTGYGGSEDSGPPSSSSLEEFNVTNTGQLLLFISPLIVLCSYFICILCKRHIMKEEEKHEEEKESTEDEQED